MAMLLKTMPPYLCLTLISLLWQGFLCPDHHLPHFCSQGDQIVTAVCSRRPWSQSCLNILANLQQISNSCRLLHLLVSLQLPTLLWFDMSAAKVTISKLPIHSVSHSNINDSSSQIYLLIGTWAIIFKVNWDQDWKCLCLTATLEGHKLWSKKS